MDVSALDQGAWFEFPMTKGRVLKLKLRPASGKEKVFLAEKFTETKMGMVDEIFAPFVMAWNLTKGQDAIPCNDDTKAQYLNFYMLETLERKAPAGPGEEAPPEQQIWSRVLEIVKSLDFFSLG